jgi:hypothetical protein
MAPLGSHGRCGWPASPSTTPSSGGAAITALALVDEQPFPSWQLRGATVCHGLAGLLAVATRIAAEAASAPVAKLAERTAATILADYREDAHWGFQHVQGSGPLEGAALDLPGLLTGAAGTALALREWADTEMPTGPRPVRPGRVAAGPAWGMPFADRLSLGVARGGAAAPRSDRGGRAHEWGDWRPTASWVRYGSDVILWADPVRPRSPPDVVALDCENA